MGENPRCLPEGSAFSLDFFLPWKQALERLQEKKCFAVITQSRVESSGCLLASGVPKYWVRSSIAFLSCPDFSIL